MGMKVISLEGTRFTEACCRLSQSVTASGFIPKAVVGIATGGAVVAEAMPMDGAKRFAVTCRRPGSRAKGGLFRRVVGRLPRRVADWLRIAESRCYEMTGRLRAPHVPVVTLPPSLREWLLENPHASVLVVDDAVDSGATLRGVLDAMARVAPEADVRSAVITVTRANPITDPDFALYRDRTLVRFPWAADAVKVVRPIVKSLPAEYSTAIIDLDGTLVSWNTFTRFVKFAFGRSGVRARSGIARAVVSRKLRRISHWEAKRRIVKIVETEIERGRVTDADIHVYAMQVARDVRALVLEYACRAECALLATAAPELYAAPVARILGFDGCVASGTDIECKGAEKVKAVLALGVDFDDRTLVVTDSEDDRPLMQANSKGINVMM